MNALDRLLLAGSCAFFTSIAALLLFATDIFYARVPGIAASGPMNAHLLRDVGIAYAVVAIGLASAFGTITRAKLVCAGAALYLSGHAAVHVALESASGSTHLVQAEASGVYLPAIVAIVIALRFMRRA